jgi:hypothetical protein
MGPCREEMDPGFRRGGKRMDGATQTGTEWTSANGDRDIIIAGQDN